MVALFRRKTNKGKKIQWDSIENLEQCVIRSSKNQTDMSKAANKMAIWQRRQSRPIIKYFANWRIERIKSHWRTRLH